MLSFPRLLPGAVAITATVLLVPVLRAAPTLNPGLWRYSIHTEGGGQSRGQTLEHCYTKPRTVKPTAPKQCAAPVVRVKGSTARWVVSCAFGGGTMRIRSRGLITYLSGGNAFREEAVTQVVMPMGTRTFRTQVNGVRIGACTKRR